MFMKRDNEILSVILAGISMLALAFFTLFFTIINMKIKRKKFNEKKWILTEN